MLALLSSDISYGSINTVQFTTLTILLLGGALDNAYIFGTWSTIVDALYIKTQKYEEFQAKQGRIMRLLNFNEKLAIKVKDFLTSTKKNYDD